jgi:CRP/FNR family transcriptional regulator, anaerobic regulatory protein
VPCEQCPLRVLPVFRRVSAEELFFVSEIKSGELNADAGTTVLLEGTNSTNLYTLLSGWAFRYKMFPDGRRQILHFALPGDLLGLQASILGTIQHSVETLTDSLLCVFPADRLSALYTRYPSLAFDITWLATRDEQLIDEHITSLGRRNALERVAFLLLSLYKRAEDVGLAQGNKIHFPFTQQHLADALGMSLVHTNKTLKRLLKRRVVSWKDKAFEIIDREELAKIAVFNFVDTHPRPLI